MFKSVYSKFILGYLLFGLAGFLCIAIFAQKMTYTYLVRHNASKLYDEAVLMASTYEDEDSYFGDISASATRDVNLVARFLNSRIWIVRTDGRIVYDSEATAEGVTIEGFDPSAAGSYRTGYYHSSFMTEMLSVEAPINHNFHPIGYIVLHYPMYLVTASTNDILNIVYITSVMLYVLSFIILIVFTYYVYIPLRKITAGAREYAAGNLSYRIPKRYTHDEVSYLADTLNMMAADLEDSEKHQRDFIANVSHDFRSPLTSIKGFLEAVLDGTIPPEKAPVYIKRVISETERLRKLTEGMISLGSVESGRILNKSSFDINGMIRDACSANENACTAKNISFELTFEDESETVYADAGKIQQVLYNLIDNAIKFSRRDSVIYISTMRKQRKVLISVKDTGIGMPKDSVKKIWDRFYKIDTSRGRDKTGTGLGLSIVREIIQAHNETIDVVSTEGVGSEFIFSLPVSESPY